MTALVRGLTALAIVAGAALAASCSSGSTASPSALLNTGPGSPSPSSVASHRPVTSTATSPAASPNRSPAPFPTRVPAGGLHYESAATLFAQTLLAGVSVPPDAVLQTVAPPAGLPAGLGEGVDSKVDLEHWYTVPGTRDAAFAWMQAHSPGGFVFGENQTVNLGGPSQDNPRILALGSDVPSRQPPGAIATSLLQDGDHVDLRVSVEVVWTPPKSRLETIPASVTTGALVYHRERTSTGLAELRRQVTLDAAQVDRLRRLLNPIPPEPAGAISSCPEATDTATLNLSYAGQQIVFSIELGGCSDITVTADGKEQPAMRGGYALGGPVRTMVGLPASPPA